MVATVRCRFAHANNCRGGGIDATAAGSALTNHDARTEGVGSSGLPEYGLDIVVVDQDGVQHVLSQEGEDEGICLFIQAPMRMTSMDHAADEFQSVVHPTSMKLFLVRVQPTEPR
jgi:hypothetical protein